MQLVGRLALICSVILIGVTAGEQPSHAQNRNLCLANCAKNNSSADGVKACQSYCPGASSSSAPATPIPDGRLNRPLGAAPPGANGVAGLSPQRSGAGTDCTAKIASRPISDCGCAMLVETDIEARHPENTVLCHSEVRKICKKDHSKPSGSQFGWVKAGACVPNAKEKDAANEEGRIRTYRKAIDDQN